MLLPGRHDRGPREPFTRETDSTLRHSPEDKRFLQLRDRPGIGEIRRNRIERKRMQPAPVQVVAVAEVAILEENLATFPHVFQIAFRFWVPRIGILLHQATHSLLDDEFIAVLLIVLAFRIGPVGIL